MTDRWRAPARGHGARRVRQAAARGRLCAGAAQPMKVLRSWSRTPRTRRACRGSICPLLCWCRSVSVAAASLTARTMSSKVQMLSMWVTIGTSSFRRKSRTTRNSSRPAVAACALLFGAVGCRCLPASKIDRVQFRLACTNKFLADDNKHHQKVSPILRVYLNEKVASS